MEAYQQRVAEERNQLIARRDKLNTFLSDDVFKTLDDSEQKRMIVQCGLMNAYVDILDQRIAAFPQFR